MGSLSMTCYGVGVDPGLCEAARGAARLPGDIPADQTNT
jgi:4,5-DOPA dioxygenase extradiol